MRQIAKGEGLLPLWLAAGVLLVAGCGRSEPPPTLQSMYDEERSLPALYIEPNTGERVTVAGDHWAYPQDGKLFWPALTCTNPECPAAGGKEPVLFTSNDPAVSLNADGTINEGGPGRKPRNKHAGQCPECLKTRNLASETEADRQRYLEFVQPYVLPETAQRRAELAAARQARQQALRERMSQ